MWRSAALVIVLSQALAGCSLGGGGHASSSQVASPEKLGVLRQSFADPRAFHRAASTTAVDSVLPIALLRPQAPLASDRSIDSVWTSTGDTPGAKSIVVVWRSGVVETIDRWRCNCEAATHLKDMGGHSPFRFLVLRGAPAVTDQSFPGQRNQMMIGPVPPAVVKYGRPATVETIREGYRITLWRFGAHTQAGLLAAAQTLPLAHATFRVDGYEAGGEALGNWNGPRGIEVAPDGGATFGIGFALQNATGKPLTITGVNAMNGFIRLIGVHLRAYTPPSGSIAPTLIHRPYGATPERLEHVVRPNAWVAMQLDYRVRNPCITWAQTIYDRTVEVAYTQNGVDHVQEVPMVPLTITRRHAHCS
jgi:hypothetical protein